jgi:hypothetical protein
MEKLMGSNIIRPHVLQYYYLPPNEAKAQNALIQGLKAKFQEVKGVQSKDKLACKGTLLNVITSKEIIGG